MRSSTLSDRARSPVFAGILAVLAVVGAAPSLRSQGRHHSSPDTPNPLWHVHAGEHDHVVGRSSHDSEAGVTAHDAGTIHTHGGVAHVHDGSALRPWALAGRQGAVHGSFLGLRGGRVLIEEPGGTVRILDVATLADPDRRLAEALAAKIRALQDVATAAAPDSTVLVALPAHALAGPLGSGPLGAPTVFELFAPHVKTRRDATWLYVESDGLPHEPLAHPMMIGIRSWQQQVPLPQRYSGGNAWQIPLAPRMADTPVSAKTALRRGAIALAANGVPIFNALNNRGDDAFLAGELDDFGGHSGRADDYHYHVAPLHLRKIVGGSAPIAYALDGFPLYGLFDPAAKAGSDFACPLRSTEKLDEWNGHLAPGSEDPARRYHYHASKGYPYLNGGMRGVVTVREDQIDPQPRADPVRPAERPLRGAGITGFRTVGPRSWSLEYGLNGATHRVDYRVAEDGRVTFDFVAPDGTKTTKEFTPRAGRRPRGNDAPQGSQSPAPLGPADRRNTERRSDAPPSPGSPRPNPPSSNPPSSNPPSSNPPSSSAPSSSAPSSSAPSSSAPSPSAPSPGAPSPGAPSPNPPPPSAPSPSAPSPSAPSPSAPSPIAPSPSAPSPIAPSPSAPSPIAPSPSAPSPSAPSPSAPSPSAPASGAPASGAPASGAPAPASAPTLAPTSTPPSGPATGSAPNPPATSAPSPNAPSPSPPHQDENRRGGPPGGPQKTSVPAHPFSILLARPTTTAVTASVIASTGLEAYFEYGASSGSFDRRTPTRRLAAGEPELFLLDGLPRHSAGSYRFRHRNPASEDAPFASEPPESFQLLRSPGSAFTFTIQADSHLDANVDPAVYLRALENARADRPDFHVDLGDTFMTDKYPKFQEARPQYDAQRWYLGQIGRTAPVFMVLGNHDGEAGYAASGATSIAAWSYAERTRRFPPPLVGQESLDLYRGRTAFVDGRGSNFYTYTWGDATFVVLDPFWPTTERVRGNGRRGVQALANVNTDANWTRTLGREQYDWLATTLATSRSRYLFVFLHHLVGGFGREARGGVESSIYFEWGGKNADGSEGFAAHRPGWPRPIHDLLRDARVSAVFHGHDHLYVRNERDGVVYQCVPQPGNPAGGTRSAEDYGYRSGTILGSPGHLRVRVTPTEATIEYLRSSLDAAPSRRRDPPPNAAVVHRYALAPRTL